MWLKICDMKKLILTALALIFFDAVFSQYVILTPPDKAVVYFVRTDKAMKGGANGPIVYDGRDIVSRINPGTFYRYECDPGDHTFWINRFTLGLNPHMVDPFIFCDANLESGKIYLIYVKIKSFKGCRLFPVNPSTDWETVEKIRSVMDNKSSIELSGLNEMKNKDKKKPKLYENAITKTLEDFYPKHKAKDRILTLEPEWYVTREELMYGKKKDDSELQ